MVGVYAIISPSNKIYIGQSWDIKTRFSYYKCHEAKDQPFLRHSFKKYGFDTHELKVLHELPNDIEQTVMDNYEIFYMQSYKDAGFILLNIKEGGWGGRHSEETKQKMSLAAKGKKKNKEAVQKMILTKTGKKLKPHSEETIKKIKESNIKSSMNKDYSVYRTDEYRKSQSEKVKQIWQDRKAAVTIKK